MPPTLSVNSRTYSVQPQNTEEENSKDIVDASKDRSKVIPVEVSIRYLQSSGKLSSTNGLCYLIRSLCRLL